MTRRASQLQRTRDALRRAALDLFVAKGYDATSVAEIAAAVGVTERTFFRHYATKDAVLLDRSRERFDVLGDALAAIDPEHPSWDDVLTALQQVSVRLQEQVEHLDQVAQTVVQSPSLDSRRREHRALWEEWATEVLAREVLAREDAAGPAAFLAAAVVTALNRGQELWVRGEGSITLSEAMSRAVDEARLALPRG